MSQEYNKYQYEYFKEIESLCVVLCTDEPKYIDEDSHFIHIPKQLFIELTNKININTMCFEITNPSDPLTKIFIKKIEPATGDFEKYIWLPNWICAKLNIQSIGDKIDFVPIENPKEIKRIKIQGDLSSYIKLDIKKLLESKLEQFRCINLNTQFHIDNIVFEVKELVARTDESVRFGIITNEVEIDFETPKDIKFLEKKKYIMDIISDKLNKNINDKLNLNSNSNSNSNSNKIPGKIEKKTGIFNFSSLFDEKKDHMNISNPNEKINLDWILNEIIAKINSSDNNFENIPNENNIILTPSDIPLITELIEKGKNTMLKMEEEHKLKKNKKNSDSCCKNDDKTKNNPIIYFNTTPYKLNDSDEIEKGTGIGTGTGIGIGTGIGTGTGKGTGTGTGTGMETDIKTTKSIDEIRKLRLEKFKQNIF
jgi:hypothetical protein